MYWLLEKIKMCYNRIKWAIQRVRRGYDDRALWNLEHYLLDLLPDMIKDLRTTTQSYPSEINFPEIKDFKDWEAILSRIEFCLREANEEQCHKKNMYDDLYDAQLVNSYVDSEGNWHNTVDDDIFKLWLEEQKKIEKYRDEMKDEALDLLKKYWWDLWD